MTFDMFYLRCGPFTLSLHPSCAPYRRLFAFQTNYFRHKKRILLAQYFFLLSHNTRLLFFHSYTHTTRLVSYPISITIQSQSKEIDDRFGFWIMNRLNRLNIWKCRVKQFSFLFRVGMLGFIFLFFFWNLTPFKASSKKI